MEINGDVTDAGRTDEQTTNDEQGKIVLLSLWTVGRLSFAIGKFDLCNTNQFQVMLESKTFRLSHSKLDPSHVEKLVC